MSNQIDFIVNSTKPYPDWLKDHPVFKNLSKLDKVFTRLGLPNMRKEIEICNSEAKNAAQSLYSKLIQELASRKLSINQIMAGLLLTEGRERNEKLAKLQYVSALVDAVSYWSTRHPAVETIENKASIILRLDVFDGKSNSPLFKKGQSILKIFSFINDLLTEVHITPIKYEDFLEFKNYSRLNIGGTKYDVVFSADGEEGAWDISTASMRGISSCQAWSSPQSRGLIGSVSSKYLGIMYIPSKTEKCEPYGSKMLYRVMVRLMIHNTTKEPAFLIDRMYPAYHPDINNAFKKLLEDHSGLKVFSQSTDDGANIQANYFTPDEISRKYLKIGEPSYMDLPLHIKASNVIFAPKNMQATTTLATIRTKIILAMEKLMIERRNTYTTKVKEIKDYYTKISKDCPDRYKNIEVGDKPTIEPMFQDLKKGEAAYQNILNLFTHCDTRYGTNSATKQFLIPILDILIPNNFQFASEAEAHRILLREFVRNQDQIKQKAWEKLNQGSWKTCFPKSSKRFFETICEELKKGLIAAWAASK
jgi:hypothetical protein